MIETPKSSGTYTAYIDKNQPEDAPVLTVVKHVHGTTSIILPKTLNKGELINVRPEADSVLEDNGFKRVEDWNAEDQYRLSADCKRS